MRSHRISHIFAFPFRHPLLLVVALLFTGIFYAVSSQASLYEIENPQWVLTMATLILLSPIFNGLFILLAHGIKTGNRLSLQQAITRTLSCYVDLIAGEIMVNIGVILGSVLFFFPGVYLGLRWIFYKQEIVIDGARGIAAIRMSSERTRDWRSLLSLVLLLAPFYAPTFLIAYVVIALPLGVVGDVLVFIVSALTFAWTNTLLTEMYVPREEGSGDRGLST
jgi:hypothetical protein